MRQRKWRVERHPSLDSTNRAAAECILAAWQKAESADGLVIVADRQSAGKGQHGRVWESPPGGLYLSAIVETVPAPLRDKLAIIAGVATVQALTTTTQNPITLQWPNDLLLARKKLGGILCESVASAQRWAGIIGIGINVHNPIHDLSPDIRWRATSLANEHAHPFTLPQIEQLILDALDHTLTLAATAGLAPIIEQARRLDALRGQRLELQDGTRTIQGTAAGIGDGGELLLQTADRLEAFTTGTINSIGGVRLRE